MQDPSGGTITPDGPTVFKHDNIRAIGWILLSVFASSAMTIAVRQISLELDPRMIVMLRFGITCAILIAAILISGKLRNSLQFSRPGVHVIRGICMGISTHLGFYAIANIDLVTVTVLFFMVPIFATGLAGFMNGEHAGPRRLAAVAVSFVGVMLILRPGYAPFQPAMLAALLSSVLFALALVLARRVAQADGAFSTLVSSVGITTLITLPLVTNVWEMPSSTTAWWIVALLVATGLIRLLADIQAYRIGEASVLAPITYLRLILIGVSAYLLFGELPDAVALMGAAIIIAAALYITRRETMLKKQSSIAAKQ